MSDMFLGSQTPLYQNVCITRRSKTGKILEQRTAKNRVTRLMLYGIGKFLLGHFNNSSPDKIYEFIPRYLALGTNVPGADAATAGVTTISSVNDARLLSEITQASTTGASESVKRIWIAERNMCKLNTKFSDPFIKLSIKTYISSNHYDGMSIGEAGLFSKEKDNNCLARVCFAPITKNSNEVLDIQWDITLLSYGETKYAESLSIENGEKIVLPLRYSTKLFKTISSGLSIDTFSQTISAINNDSVYEIFTYDENGILKLNRTETELKNSIWYKYLQDMNLESLYDSLKNQLIKSKLDNITTPYYLISTHQHVPIMLHFGSLHSQLDSANDSNMLYMTLLYNEDHEYKKEVTGWNYISGEKDDTYYVYDPNGRDDEYKIVENRFYKKDKNDDSKWNEINAFLYKGAIVDINRENLGYSYSDGNFYKTTTAIIQNPTDQFLNYSNKTDTKTLLPDEKLYIYNFDEFGTVQRSGYSIDINVDQKIYFNDEFTDYHLSLDNYWVSGDYEKLIPIILPKSATDRTINWYIQNSDIAKINWDGVVTAWNLGETTVTASTINDLRSKCTIEVIKDTTFVDIDSITLEPSEITFIIDANNSINQSYTIIAKVNPLFASNPTVTWSVSSEISNSVSLVNLGNNTVKAMLKSGAITGIGEIIATSQSGKTGKCKVNILYSYENNECDCDNPIHLYQER